MSRCVSNSLKVGEITSANELKNIPLDFSNISVAKGYSLVYEDNKFILKNISGGGTGVDLETVLLAIKEGKGITIDRSVPKQITINSTGGSEGGVNILPFISDAIPSERFKEGMNIANFSPSKVLPQDLNDNLSQCAVWAINSSTTYRVGLKSKGSVLVTLLPNTAVLVLKIGSEYSVVLTIKDYTKDITNIEKELKTKLGTDSKIYDLSDVPSYTSSDVNSVLTKTGSGLSWVVPSGTGGVDTFLQLKDTPSTYKGAKYKGVRVNKDENNLEFIDILSGIIAGKNITIDKGTDGDITINSTGGGGVGEFPYVVESNTLNIKDGFDPSVEPFVVKQTSGNQYSTLAPLSTPTVVKIYSNGDIEAYGTLLFNVQKIDSSSPELSGAVNIALYLPVPKDIEVDKEYRVQRSGVNLYPNPLGNKFTNNTFVRSGTTESGEKYVLVQIAYTCFGNQEYYANLSNTSVYVPFSVRCIAQPKVYNFVKKRYYEPQEIIDLVAKGEMSDGD